MPPDADAFLDAGAPPVVFTPGSAASTLHRYFSESVTALRTLGVRAMGVTNFVDQVPTSLPPGVQAFGYLPFSELLPRAAMLVYHGGIGTLAQAVKAGVPHLVVPNGHDQFDTGWRIERLGLGRSRPQTRYRAKAVAEALGSVLSDTELKKRCRDYVARIDSDKA